MRWMVICVVLLFSVILLGADKGRHEQSASEETGSARKAKKDPAKKDRGKEPDEVNEHFPDYRPKISPDTVLDYRPSLSGQVNALPPAKLESLNELMCALMEYKTLAEKSPGKYEEGNIILGADKKQYVPSDEELLENEVGERIRRVIGLASRDDLVKLGIKGDFIEYTAITFRHVDVMGSGRFFYASFPEKQKIDLKKP